VYEIYTFKFLAPNGMCRPRLSSDDNWVIVLRVTMDTLEQALTLAIVPITLGRNFPRHVYFQDLMIAEMSLVKSWKKARAPLYGSQYMTECGHTTNVLPMR